MLGETLRHQVRSINVPMRYAAQVTQVKGRGAQVEAEPRQMNRELYYI
jgi:hypothetical protein